MVWVRCSREETAKKAGARPLLFCNIAIDLEVSAHPSSRHRWSCWLWLRDIGDADFQCQEHRSHRRGILESAARDFLRINDHAFDEVFVFFRESVVSMIAREILH